MTRTIPAVLLAALTIVVAACGGTPKASPLTDPTAILTAAATQTANASGVHVDVKADGSLALDLTGAGSAAPVQLTDSTAAADFDLKGGNGRVTFTLPGILGLRGELLLVDGTGYLKSSLTGPQYRSMTLGGGGVPLPSGSPDTTSMISALTAFLAKPELAPVKGADVDCGGTTCYTVTIQLTPDEIRSLTGEGSAGGSGALPIPSALPIPIPSLGDMTVDLTARVEQDTNRLAGLTAAISTGADAKATIDATFSKWDQAVSVSAPPADQVAPAGG